jgi:iron complex outermembrane recepter protein
MNQNSSLMNPNSSLMNQNSSLMNQNSSLMNPNSSSTPNILNKNRMSYYILTRTKILISFLKRFSSANDTNCVVCFAYVHHLLLNFWNVIIPKSEIHIPKSIVFFLLISTQNRLIGQTNPIDTLSQTLSAIEIVSTTPTQGNGFERRRVPSAIQSIRAKEMQNSGVSNLTQYLNQQIAGLHLNFASGNPLQPDLNYRGFTASPVLGLPQGLAIFQDGERLNELFGNVVNWDVLPVFALESGDLLPGSNPVFGLNALGGAISLQTKSGFSSPLKTLMIEMGSFGRKYATTEYGWNNGKWGYYAGGDFFAENGWRDYSASQASRFLTKISRQTEKGMIHLSLSLANSRLRGNGPAPIELLKENRSTVFTHPDITENQLIRLNLNISHRLNANWRLNTTIFGNIRDNKTFNGDETPYVVCDTGRYAGMMCHEKDSNDSLKALKPVLNQNGSLIRATDFNQTAINNRTHTRQYSVGSTFQLASDKALLGKKNQFIAGISFDGGIAQFQSTVELGKLTTDRGTEGANLYDSEAAVNMNFKAAHTNVFFVESISPIEPLTIQIAGQLQNSVIQLRDNLGDELNGDHYYTRFNPSVGLVWQMNPTMNVYGNYAMAARTPTPVELTCADPNAPCRLPNAFLSDPPLKQAVAQTQELGFRFKKQSFSIETAVFQTLTKDDIYFISAGPSRNTGYFSNIGNTLRTGFEFSGKFQQKKVAIYANYTFLNATFKSDFTINNNAHPAAKNSEIKVQTGNRIPLIPQHLAKAGIQFRFSTGTQQKKNWLIGAELLFNGNQVFRGDESNELDPIKGYLTGNLFLNGQMTSKITLFGRVENCWNQSYETFGLLGEPNRLPVFSHFEAPYFITPASPLSASLGIRFKY